MGAKRRRHSSRGNIRKRPRTAAKQTLVRVAQFKEAAADKLHRRLERAEARELDRTRAALGIQPRPNRGEIRDADVASQDENLEGEEAWRAKHLQKCEQGYGSLITDLAHPLFEPPPTSPHRDEDLSSTTLENGHANPAKVEEPSNAVSPRSTTKSAPALSITNENIAAATREKAHFGLDLPPPEPSIPEKSVQLGLYPAVGRVSALAPPDRRAALQAMLRDGLSSMSERALGMQPSMHARWIAAGMGKGRLGPLERSFVAVLREYMDVFLCRALTDEQDDVVRRLYVAHCVAHVLRVRARVVRNDGAVKKDPEAVDHAKDQGFSRTRVLLLLPMRNVAYEAIKAIADLAVEPGPNVQNRERFENEFAPEENDKDDESDEEDAGSALSRGKGVAKRRRKPADHRRIFRGNIEDDFKLGISFSKKSIKLYADFNDSDIIVASPLGLRRSLAEKASGKTAHDRLSKKKEESEDTEWKTGIGAARPERKHHDADEGFLSSVEICIVDGAHIFSMQNWDTLRKATDMLNKMPSNTSGTDFSRVRAWCLDGLMHRFRQTVVLSRYRKSEFVSLVRNGSNHAGRVQLLGAPSAMGSMANVIVGMRQTFFKVPNIDSPSSRADKRFLYFCGSTLPLVRCLIDAQILLVIPDYFDYVRVRNKLLSITEEDESFRFASMCEYSKGSDISRARGKLHDRSVGLVVITERFHFFWRHWLRGADTVIWYGLPENEHFYPEILNMTGEAADSGRQVQTFALYDEFDTFKLEGIVGRKRCKKMTSSDSKSTFLFM